MKIHEILLKPFGEGAFKLGFTLAEVLITLGIIGVVAALTLPTLITKHKNQVYVNKLKKMVSTLENGVRQAAAEESVEVTQSSLFGVLQFYCTDMACLSKRYNIINKYFKIVGKDEILHNNIQQGAIKFMDGGAIEYTCNGYDLLIDINGDEKPNQYGKDIFRVIFDQNGMLHDTDDCSHPTYYMVGDNSTYSFVATSCGLCKNNSDADKCYLYRIKSDGWQMKY